MPLGTMVSTVTEAMSLQVDGRAADGLDEDVVELVEVLDLALAANDHRHAAAGDHAAAARGVVLLDRVFNVRQRQPVAGQLRLVKGDGDIVFPIRRSSPPPQRRARASAGG